jgi:hypothetical protein
MTDWDQLRAIGEHTAPPSFDSLVETAHQRDHRRRIVTGAVTLSILGALALGAWMANKSDDGAIQPIKDPSDRSTSDQVALPDGVLPLPEADASDEAVTTEPGRYRVALDKTRAFDVELPVGTSVNSDGLYMSYKDTLLKVETAGEGYGVPDDPCVTFNFIKPVGPTVDDLVTAIRGQSLYRVRDLAPVEIDGAPGRYLELRFPPGFDASPCVDEQLGLPGNPGSNNNMEPGYVGRWWIVDVDGHRTVVQVFAGRSDAEGFERMANVAEGITFTPTP